jgi:hypothetical protein
MNITGIKDCDDLGETNGSSWESLEAIINQISKFLSV